MDWTTIALIAIGLAAAALILWAVFFAILARHVMRFQNRVAEDMLRKPEPPTWQSSRTSRTYGPRRSSVQPEEDR